MLSHTTRSKQLQSVPLPSSIKVKNLYGYGYNLTSDQLTEITESFNLFDPNKTGTITYHELKAIMRALGFDVKKS